MPFPVVAAVGAVARAVGPKVLSATTRAARSKIGTRVVQGMAFKAGMNAFSGNSKKMTETSNNNGIVNEYTL